jgi:predicted nucleic acid-binding protein
VKRSVLDSSAVITFLKNRSGAEKVAELLSLADAGERELYMCVVNWGEVFYSVWRGGDKKAAEQVEHEISRMPIRIVEADMELTKIAAEFKAKSKLPYADCFVAAAAKMMNAEVVTADQDFLLVDQELNVTFI